MMYLYNISIHNYFIMNKLNNDVEKHTQTEQVGTGYVAVSKGYNYKKCCSIVLMCMICSDILCCICLITGIVLFKFVFVVQSIDLEFLNITNTTLQVTNNPTQSPTYYPTQSPIYVPSYSPTYEIPQ